MAKKLNYIDCRFVDSHFIEEIFNILSKCMSIRREVLRNHRKLYNDMSKFFKKLMQNKDIIKFKYLNMKDTSFNFAVQVLNDIKFNLKHISFFISKEAGLIIENEEAFTVSNYIHKLIEEVDVLLVTMSLTDHDSLTLKN